MTPEQRATLLKTYLEKGYDVAKPLAIEYGVTPGYLSLLARNKGHFKAKVVSQIRRSRSRMWDRAVENGSVLA